MTGHTGDNSATAEAELLPAREVGELLGKSKRTILSWRELGCPHETGRHRGRQCELFDPVATRAWVPPWIRTATDADAQAAHSPS